MEQPLVSVVTITRNRAKLIGRCIASVLGQTYNNIEHIVVDGASDDDTDEVVASFHDERLHFVKLETNWPLLETINYGVSLAKGKYLTFLDSDDEYCTDKVKKQVELFEKLPDDYGLVYCWMTYFDAAKNNVVDHIHKVELKGDVRDEVVAYPSISGTPTLMFRIDFFRQLGGWKSSDEIGIISDWEMCCRACQLCKVDYVPESLVNVYINHGHTRMSNSKYYAEFDKKQIKFHNYFLNKYEDVFKNNPQITWYHLRCIVIAYFHMGDFKKGFRYYKQLLRVNHNAHCVIAPAEAVLRRLMKR